MVRQWQNLFYSERYSNTDLGTHKHRIPDFKLLAEAMGCVGLRAESRDEVDRVIHEAMAVDDRPVVIDFVVGADAQVWPMVAAGTGNDQIMAARDIRPLFEGDELVADISVEAEVTAKAQQESTRNPSTQEAGK
jgi:acetolactate synthase-1/2/3 large subunit